MVNYTKNSLSINSKTCSSLNGNSDALMVNSVHKENSATLRRFIASE